MPDPDTDKPIGNVQGLRRYAAADIRAGFLVFLIALPLCLGIAMASGFPPIAGVFTAIVGGILGTLISDSELTIKGPAAGLIVVVLGCVQDFGGDGIIGGFSPEDIAAYRATLAVGFAAAIAQIVFGLLKGGKLADFFPLSAVHGMLAAIGAIIILKQFPIALGVPAEGEPLELIAELPKILSHTNPAIALIGLVSLAAMFAWPVITKRLKPLASIPSPVVVLAIALAISTALDLTQEHTYQLAGHTHDLGPQFLVTMPDRVFGLFDEITTPTFSALTQPVAWKWVAVFFIIGTLESVLSAKAVELIDPFRRRTNLDRDTIAIGTGNAAASLVGGMPMISEIVRSRANVDSGARTRFANLYHGLFLLACVALIPALLHRIPLAALAAMLVYTGYRLAHPTEFRRALRIGPDQLAAFLITFFAVLATDLLIGVAIGIAAELIIHLAAGAPLRSLLVARYETKEAQGNTQIITVSGALLFTNWTSLRLRLLNLGLKNQQSITLDLTQTRLVDHSAIDKLTQLQARFKEAGLTLHVIGLEKHRPNAPHPLATRTGPPRVR